MNEKHDESLTIACISIVGGTALFNCISSVLQSGLGCMVIAEERDIIDEVTRLISDKHLELVVTHGDSVPGKRAIAVRKAASAWIDEDLAVTLDHADETGATLHSRFNHGRLYGGLQSRNMRPAIRMVRALTCVLLPFVLSYRSLRAYARVRNRNLVTFLYIILFETVWSCGECTGYLSGCGHSLEDWK